MVAGNLFLSNSNMMFTIVILDSKGNLLHKISYFTSKPLAVAIDSCGRIIVVDRGLCINIY